MTAHIRLAGISKYCEAGESLAGNVSFNVSSRRFSTARWTRGMFRFGNKIAARQANDTAISDSPITSAVKPLHKGESSLFFW